MTATKPESKAAPKGKGHWMEHVVIKRPGICTGPKLGSKSCPKGSRQYALAKTFERAAARRKAADKK